MINSTVISIGESQLLEEKWWHINVLELKAIPLGLKSFIKEEKIHIKVFADSTTAIGCINKLCPTQTYVTISQS